MSMDLTGIGAVADLAKDVIGRFFPDKSEQERQQIAMALTVIQGQFDANKAEAASPSVFVAGWRPFIGWVCGSAFAVQFVAGPLMQWMSTLVGHPVTFPTLEMSEMMPILLGMLGLGGLRTYEKRTGTATSLTK